LKPKSAKKYEERQKVADLRRLVVGRYSGTRLSKVAFSFQEKQHRASPDGEVAVLQHEVHE